MIACSGHLCPLYLLPDLGPLSHHLKEGFKENDALTFSRQLEQQL